MYFLQADCSEKLPEVNEDVMSGNEEIIVNIERIMPSFNTDEALLISASCSEVLCQTLGDILEFFLNRAELSLDSVNSANSGNLISH